MAAQPKVLAETLMKCSLQRFLSAAGFVILIIIVSCNSLRAQSCVDGSLNEVQIESLLEGAYQRCGFTDDPLIYRIAAVADTKAIPALLAFAHRGAYPCTNFHDAVETALAKLGDSDALQYLARAPDLRHLTIVGNDHAIAIMMAYFEQHRSEELYFWQGDYWSAGPLVNIAAAIGDRQAGGVVTVGIPSISERRWIPDLPSLTPGSGASDDQFKTTWIDWWQKHKGGEITTAPYESVQDPYLRCLAREVDWGLPDALLEIADRGGPEALAALQKFPTPSGGPVVRLNRFQSISPSFGALGTMSGDLVLALAKLGDENQFARVASTLGYRDTEEELEYIGGRKSMQVLIGELKTPAEFPLQDDEVADCVRRIYGPKPIPGAEKDKFTWRWCRDRVAKDYQGEVRSMEAQQSYLLTILSHMVADPPLPPNAAFSAENVEKWRTWWAKNKDTAQFIPNPLKADQLVP